MDGSSDHVVIVGAGGLGREAAALLRETPRHDRPLVKGFLDDDVAAARPARGAPLLGTTGSYEPLDDDVFIVTIGDPAVRAAIVDRLAAKGARFVTLVHPLSNIATTASIGQGTFVSAFCTVSNDARLDEHVVMLPYSLAGHDSVIGRCTTMSPHSVANGETRLGEGTFLGSMACVNPSVHVGRWVKVAAGSVVYEAVPDGCLVEGNPGLAHSMGYHLSGR